MYLQFRRGVTAGPAAEVIGDDLYQATVPVKLGCGHTAEVNFSLTVDQLAKMAADYLGGSLPPAEEIVERMTSGMRQVAPTMRCATCQQCVLH